MLSLPPGFTFPAVPSCSVMCDCLLFLTWVIVYVLSIILSVVFHNQLILYKYALHVLRVGLLYPGPEYEATICFIHYKQSKLEVGL